MDEIKAEKYANFVESSARFPRGLGIWYCVTKLCGEVGELCEKINALDVDHYGHFRTGFLTVPLDQVRDNPRRELLKEAGDVVWYTVALSQQLGYHGNINHILRSFADSGSGADYNHPSVFARLGLGLSTHAGRIAEYTGKIIRDKGGDGTNDSFLLHSEYVFNIRSEIRRVVGLTEVLAFQCHTDLETVVDLNVEKLRDRRARGVEAGSGDNR